VAFSLEKMMNGFLIVKRGEKSVHKREKCFKSSDLIHYTGEHYSTFTKRANSAAGQIVWPDEVYIGVQRIFDDYETFQLLVQHRLMKSGLRSASAASLVVDLKPVFLPGETLFCLLRSEPLPAPQIGADWPKESIKSWTDWKEKHEGKRDAILKIARDGAARKRNKDPEEIEVVPVFYAYHGKITEFEALVLDPANKAVLSIDVHSVQAEVQAIRDLNWKRKNARKD
jgi:hypothetical protein